jgi:hypothetical protein
MGSTKVQAPPPRDAYKERSDEIRAQIDLAPEILAAERNLVPQFQRLQYDQMIGQSQNLRSFYREVMGDSANLFADYGTLFAGKMAPIAKSSREAYDVGLGGGAELQEAMRRSAVADLNAGMMLTPEMEREAMNRARAAMTLRGLAGGGQGVAAEVLSGYNMGLARQDRARSFAQSVLGNDVNMSNAAFTQYGSPLISSGMNALSPMGLAGLSVQYNQNLGPQYINPESQYAANVNASNYNAQLQAAIASAQNKTALTTGLISGAGNFFSSAVGKGGMWGKSA